MNLEIIKSFSGHFDKELDPDAYLKKYSESNIIVNASSKNVFYPTHPGVLSVKYVLSGGEYYTTRNSRYLVTKENFLIVNNGTEYSSFIDSDNDVESLTVHFSPRFISETIDGLISPPESLLDPTLSKRIDIPFFIEKTYQEDKLVVPYLIKIHSLLDDADIYKERISDILTGLCINLLMVNEEVAKEISNVHVLKPSTKAELYKRLNYAKDFIDCCYDQNISIEGISKNVCINREYFFRQFKLLFNISPAQYLIQKRMTVAKQMLESMNISVTDACHLVGYKDLASFSKLFKRHFNSTPENLNHENVVF